MPNFSFQEKNEEKGMSKRKREVEEGQDGMILEGEGERVDVGPAVKKDRSSLAHMPIEDYQIPIHKLRSPSKEGNTPQHTTTRYNVTQHTGSIPLVLFACGCFSPITNLHLYMFGKLLECRIALCSLLWCVVWCCVVRVVWCDVVRVV